MGTWGSRKALKAKKKKPDASFLQLNILNYIMKCKTLILIMLMLTGAVSAQDTVRLTLDSCLHYAYRHNLQVQSATLSHATSEASLTGAKLRFLPSVSATASEGWGWADGTSGRNTQYGLNGSLTLFSGLSNLRSLQQSRIGADQSALKVQQTENSIGTQVVQAYLTILMNEEMLSFLQEVLETSRVQEQEGAVKYQVGRILESDYLLLEANLTSAQTEVENTLLTIEKDRSTLKTLIGMKEAVVLEVVPGDESLRAVDCAVPSLDTLVALAREHMPDWQISAMDVDIARLNVRLAESSFLPTVSLNAGYGGGWNPTGNGTGSGNTFSDNSSLTLGVNIPIFDRGSSYTQLKQSKIALEQAELQQCQTELELENELEGVYVTLCQALNRFRSNEALSSAYRASYDVYVVKYAAGAVTTVEMLQQQNKYLSALNDWLQSKYSYLLTEKQVDIYTGKEVRL